jgi:hypothetical protein
LTADERAELEDLARSTKTEYRLRQRAQIVLLAAEGVASRAIGRKVGCTSGTASDNLNTHKPKTDRWLARHRNVHFHFTPTRASWLNQIEIWFSVLSDKSLAGASFTSVAQLRAHIDAFVDTHNQHAKPFAWTKSEVHQKRLKARFADQ